MIERTKNRIEKLKYEDEDDGGDGDGEKMNTEQNTSRAASNEFRAVWSA